MSDNSTGLILGALLLGGGIILSSQGSSNPLPPPIPLNPPLLPLHPPHPPEKIEDTDVYKMIPYIKQHFAEGETDVENHDLTLAEAEQFTAGLLAEMATLYHAKDSDYLPSRVRADNTLYPNKFTDYALTISANDDAIIHLDVRTVGIPNDDSRRGHIGIRIRIVSLRRNYNETIYTSRFWAFERFDPLDPLSPLESTKAKFLADDIDSSIQTGYITSIANATADFRRLTALYGGSNLVDNTQPWGTIILANSFPDGDAICGFSINNYYGNTGQILYKIYVSSVSRGRILDRALHWDRGYIDGPAPQNATYPINQTKCYPFSQYLIALYQQHEIYSVHSGVYQMDRYFSSNSGLNIIKRSWANGQYRKAYFSDGSWAEVWLSELGPGMKINLAYLPYVEDNTVWESDYFSQTYTDPGGENNYIRIANIMRAYFLNYSPLLVYSNAAQIFSEFVEKYYPYAEIYTMINSPIEIYMYAKIPPNEAFPGKEVSLNLFIKSHGTDGKLALRMYWQGTVDYREILKTANYPDV